MTMLTIVCECINELIVEWLTIGVHAILFQMLHMQELNPELSL